MDAVFGRARSAVAVDCRFHFTSILPEEYREDVEKLLYFNPLQARARPAIVASVEAYGQPRIFTRDGLVRIAVDDPCDVETIYALAEFEDAEQLAGILLYSHEQQDLVILHVAVGESFSSTGTERDALLAFRLFNTVQHIARQLTTVRAIVFRDPAGRVCRMRLDREAVAVRGVRGPV